MKVDEDGDGKYDYIYKAEQNSKGEIFDYTSILKLLLMPVGLLLLLVLIAIVIKTNKTRIAKVKQP